MLVIVKYLSAKMNRSNNPIRLKGKIMTHTFVDLNTEEYTHKFYAAPVYRKNVFVHARKVKETEFLNTVLENGFAETSRSVEPGSWIITNPGGEEYAVSDEKFKARYIFETKGLYRAKGKIHAFVSPVDGEVEILAPWGEPQYGAKGCFFGASINRDGSIGSDRYILGEKEFHDTYNLEYI